MVSALTFTIRPVETTAGFSLHHQAHFALLFIAWSGDSDDDDDDDDEDLFSAWCRH